VAGACGARARGAGVLEAFAFPDDLNALGSMSIAAAKRSSGRTRSIRRRRRAAEVA
jgi:hypothetical protein